MKVTDEELTLMALGELAVSEELGSEERSRLAEIRGMVEMAEEAYGPPNGAEGDIPEMSEFQKARLDRTRAESVRNEVRKNGRSWIWGAGVAAVLVIGVSLRQLDWFGGAGSNTGSDLAYQSDPLPDGTKAIRGSGGEQEAVDISSADVQALAPGGEIRVVQPFVFIWKGTTGSEVELALYQQGETEPLAVMKEASSPVSLVEFRNAAQVEVGLEAGLSYYFEIKRPGGEGVLARKNFKMAAADNLGQLTTSDLVEVAQDASTEGRWSEALMLWFAVAEEVEPEVFARERRALERKILKN